MTLPKQTPRRELVGKFRRLGWTGPWPGGLHSYMRRGTHTVRIPNPHGTDLRIGLLREILRQAGISDDEWNEA